MSTVGPSSVDLTLSLLAVAPGGRGGRRKMRKGEKGSEWQRERERESDRESMASQQLASIQPRASTEFESCDSACRIEMRLAIALAVVGWSPVTITTSNTNLSGGSFQYFNSRYSMIEESHSAPAIVLACLDSCIFALHHCLPDSLPWRVLALIHLDRFLHSRYFKPLLGNE